MKKILKQWGEGLGAYFDKEDIKIYGLKKGDVIDISDMLVTINEKIQKEVKKQ